MENTTIKRIVEGEDEIKLIIPITIPEKLVKCNIQSILLYIINELNEELKRKSI